MKLSTDPHLEKHYTAFEAFSSDAESNHYNGRFRSQSQIEDLLYEMATHSLCLKIARTRELRSMTNSRTLTLRI